MNTDKKSAKQIALDFSELFQKNYPQKPLHIMMVELEKEIEAVIKQESTMFLDDLRDYIRESGNNLVHDERTSEELYKVFKSKEKHD